MLDDDRRLGEAARAHDQVAVHGLAALADEREAHGLVELGLGRDVEQQRAVGGRSGDDGRAVLRRQDAEAPGPART